MKKLPQKILMNGKEYYKVYFASSNHYELIPVEFYSEERVKFIGKVMEKRHNHE